MQGFGVARYRAHDRIVRVRHERKDGGTRQAQAEKELVGLRSDDSADLAARREDGLLLAEDELPSALRNDGTALQADHQGKVVIAVGQELAGSPFAGAAADGG